MMRHLRPSTNCGISRHPRTRNPMANMNAPGQLDDRMGIVMGPGARAEVNAFDDKWPHRHAETLVMGIAVVTATLGRRQHQCIDRCL